MFKNTQTIVWVIICILRDNLPYTPKRTKSLKLLHLLLTDHLIICLVISLLCLFTCTCLTFKLAILFQFISDTTKCFMNPTPAKLAEVGITNYILSENSTKNMPSSFFYNFSSIFTTYHHFFNIYPQKLQLQSSFQVCSLLSCPQ